MTDADRQPSDDATPAVPSPVVVERASLPVELEALAAVGEALFLRLAANAGRTLEDALRVVPFDDGVAVVRAVRGGGTIFVGPDRTVLYQASAIGFTRGVEAFRAGARTAPERF